MPSVPQRPQSSLQFTWPDSSISNPHLGDEAAQYLLSQRFAQKPGLPASSCWLHSAAPTLFPSWFMESSALNGLQPSTPAPEELPVQGRPEGGEGSRSWVDALVSPLLLTSAWASQSRDDSANDCLLEKGCMEIG